MQEGHVIELLRPGLEGLSAAEQPIAQDLRPRFQLFFHKDPADDDTSYLVQVGGEQRFREKIVAVNAPVRTVLADDPSFTIRDASLKDEARPPLRVILDSKLRMPPTARMLDLPGNERVRSVNVVVGDAFSRKKTPVGSSTATPTSLASKRK